MFIWCIRCGLSTLWEYGGSLHESQLLWRIIKQPIWKVTVDTVLENIFCQTSWPMRRKQCILVSFVSSFGLMSYVLSNWRHSCIRYSYHYRELSSVAIWSENYDFTTIYEHIHVKLFPFDIISGADLSSNTWNSTIIPRHFPFLLWQLPLASLALPWYRIRNLIPFWLRAWHNLSKWQILGSLVYKCRHII